MEYKDLSEIREMIREILEQEMLEFSSGGVPGFSVPISFSVTRNKKRRKKKRLSENSQKFTLNNYIRYGRTRDDYHESEIENYYSSVTSLADAFCMSDNPFGSNEKSGLKRAEKYLQGNLKYPHNT